MDVASWLRHLGLEQYVSDFTQNDIDAVTLRQLDDGDLKELGVASLGHRKKLLAAIARLDDEGERSHPGTTPTPLAAERRQVTVLFADLAGFTQLMARRGSEEVHDLIERFFGCVDGLIEGHGGFIDKHIGDCVMAVFGAPVAHGNDSERAAQAALAIRDAVPALSTADASPLAVHIGVAAGQVVASGTGSDSHQQYTITGESVNLAARLTDAAGPGEILISAAVQVLVRERFTFAEVGALEVKGFETPVRVWRLLGPSGAEQGPHRPLIGRQAELRQFEGLLHSCRKTGRGRAILVRGEAGIGKTRLAEEFQRLAGEQGFLCHGCAVLDFGTGSGRDPIRALVRDLLGLDLNAEPEQVQRAASAALERGLVAPERRPFLNDLLNLPQPVEQRALYDAMNNASRNRGKTATAVELVRQASAQGPRLLLVEDLHWADALTLEALSSLTAAVADCPAILVMTSRVEGDPLDRAWRTRAGASPITTVDLGPLARQEAEALAQSYGGASAELARRCVERAAGNPLFLDQLLRHARDGIDTAVPGSVQNLVEARLDRLDAADRQALLAASVFGQHFSRDSLRHLVDDPAYDCAALVAHHLVRRQGDDFLFAHALIRDGVYDTLLRSRRRELHRRAAEWYIHRDQVLHAEHLARAEDPGAAAAFLVAARQQAAAYRYERALSLVERGLEQASATEQVALVCFKGDVLHDLGRMADALVAYQSALAEARDEHRCAALIGLAAVKRVTDDLDGAFIDLDRAEAIAARGSWSAERARIHFLRGNLHFPRGNIEGCLKEHRKSLKLAREAGSPELEAAALGGLGDAEYVRARMISAHRNFRRCVDLCREHGFGRIEVANLGMVGHTQIYFRSQSDALRAALAAVEAAARVGHRRAELNACLAVIFASILMMNGDVARAHIERAQALAHALGARRFEQPCLGYLGRLHLAEGRPRQALEVLRQARAVAEETGPGFHGGSICGALALATSDPGERADALAEGERLLRQGAVGHNHLWFYTDAIETMLGSGDPGAAERFAQALEDFTHAEPLPWADLFIGRGRALAARGQGRTDDALRRELERLRHQALQLELKIALPAIEAALAA